MKKQSLCFYRAVVFLSNLLKKTVIYDIILLRSKLNIKTSGIFFLGIIIPFFVILITLLNLVKTQIPLVLLV